MIDGKVSLYNFSGNTDLVADVAGYYSATGSVFLPTGPYRVMDSRYGLGGTNGPFKRGYSSATPLNSWKYGVPPFGVTALALNVIATNATTGGYAAVLPDRPWTPTSSNLNFSQGQTIANAVVTSSTGGLHFYKDLAGSVDLIADLAGYFTAN